MKILILISTLIFSLTASAETEADWFYPGCKKCEEMKKPGKASLGNNIGVLNTKTGNKRKKPVGSGTSNGVSPVSK